MDRDRPGQRATAPTRPATRCPPRGRWRAPTPGRSPTAATATTRSPATRAARPSRRWSAAASPTIVTTASPAAITLTTPAGPPTLSDSAVLSGGYYRDRQHHLHADRAGRLLRQARPTRSAGNGTYMRQRHAADHGDGGRHLYLVGHLQRRRQQQGRQRDRTALQGEQTVVSPASPTIVTTASPAVTLPTGPPGTVTLSDSAVLSGGYHRPAASPSR